MYLVLVFILTIIQGIILYQQEDYSVVLERVEVVKFNSKYINITIRNFKFNRTYAAFNCTWIFKQAFGNQIKINFQTYKFSSNEYRLFPLVFSMNWCEAIAKNDFGIRTMYNCGNAPKCPMAKGRYYTCNQGPDYSKFPPYMPEGRYRLDMTYIYLSEDLYCIPYNGI